MLRSGPHLMGCGGNDTHRILSGQHERRDKVLDARAEGAKSKSINVRNRTAFKCLISVKHGIPSLDKTPYIKTQIQTCHNNFIPIGT